MDMFLLACSRSNIGDPLEETRCSPSPTTRKVFTPVEAICAQSAPSMNPIIESLGRLRGQKDARIGIQRLNLNRLCQEGASTID